MFLFTCPCIYELPKYITEADMVSLKSTCKEGRRASFHNPVLVCMLRRDDTRVSSFHTDLRIGCVYAYNQSGLVTLVYDGVKILEKVHGHLEGITRLVIETCTSITDVIRITAIKFPRLRSLTITFVGRHDKSDRYELEPFWKQCHLDELHLKVPMNSEQMDIIAGNLLSRKRPMRIFDPSFSDYPIKNNTIALLGQTETLRVPYWFGVSKQPFDMLSHRPSLRRIHLVKEEPLHWYPPELVIEYKIFTPDIDQIRYYFENGVTKSLTFLEDDYTQRPIHFMKCFAVLPLNRLLLPCTWHRVLDLADRFNVNVQWHLHTGSFETFYASRATWSIQSHRVIVTNHSISLWCIDNPLVCAYTYKKHDVRRAKVGSSNASALPIRRVRASNILSFHHFAIG